MQKSIRILNFDDSVIKQERLLARYAHEVIDFKNLGPSARYFYNADTRALIERGIRNSSGDCATFIGSGDFHHLSEMLISQFVQPLSVILFDFHPDCDTSPPRYGCGSWVTEVLRKKNNLVKLVLLGVSSNDISSFNLNHGYLDALKDDRVEIYPYAHPPSRVFFKKVPQNSSLDIKRGMFSHTIAWQELWKKDLRQFFAELLKRIPEKNVYLSIDKDCLKDDYALTNWEEGKFSLDELLLLLQLVKENLNIVGLDITGDYSPILTEGIFKKVFSYLDHPKAIKAYTLSEESITSLNAETNLKILNLLIS